MRDLVRGRLHGAVDGRPGPAAAPELTGSAVVVCVGRPCRGRGGAVRREAAPRGWAMRASRALDARGFRCCGATLRGLAVLVALDRRPLRPSRARIEAGLRAAAGSGPPREGAAPDVGIGTVQDQLADAPRSFREALMALRAAARGLCGSPAFFADLGIHQLLMEIADRPEVRGFAERSLAAVLDYDRRHDAQLASTLAAYLRAGGHAQQAARALYIHRQTLYYRLARLRELLGEDFLAPHRRIGLEVALQVLVPQLAGAGAPTARRYAPPRAPEDGWSRQSPAVDARPVFQPPPGEHRARDASSAGRGSPR